ncbi:hypothetical protein G3I40_13790 [Streptomyces sp. SID14478]|uniref:hypothetical protein n=1 Tax=Streptomyces sp. SID14478 TaxID=2706073 RepID=UPI0013D98A5A|nr:hypothetical protein [Streptomyces sp. SID14478]NEB76285.1 hypothetical protein [Streptomyces sp. SID14478]
MREPTEQDLAPAAGRSPKPVAQRGSSPWDAERVRPLTRVQVVDHFQELGELYAAHSGAETGRWEEIHHAFLGRLALDMRRPGFALLVAENTRTTAFAYGFPVRAGLFVIREIVVGPRVRREGADRDWNLARRLQRRLLGDHGDATGVTLVERSDVWALEALRVWGWRDAPRESWGAPLFVPCRVLLLDP